jgi:hypothetical protein
MGLQRLKRNRNISPTLLGSFPTNDNHTETKMLTSMQFCAGITFLTMQEMAPGMLNRC